MAPLIPFNPPLGVFPQFCFPQENVLHMKEKAFSFADDFTITTASGVELLKCKGKILSISDKKIFTDLQGNEIFHLKNRHFTIHRSFVAEKPDGTDLFLIKGQFSLLSTKSQVVFKNAADGRPVEIDVKGDWFDRSAEITCGGQAVAHISRSFFNVTQIFADKQTYFVKCAPGVDLAMIAAICVSLDETEEKK